MIELLIIVALIAAVAIVIAVIVGALRRSRSPDGVATFRRQINALSPEARKPVVEKLQQLDERGGEENGPDEPDRPPAEEDQGGG